MEAGVAYYSIDWGRIIRGRCRHGESCCHGRRVVATAKPDRCCRHRVVATTNGDAWWCRRRRRAVAATERVGGGHPAVAATSDYGGGRRRCPIVGLPCRRHALGLLHRQCDLGLFRRCHTTAVVAGSLATFYTLEGEEG